MTNSPRIALRWSVLGWLVLVLVHVAERVGIWRRPAMTEGEREYYRFMTRGLRRGKR